MTSSTVHFAWMRDEFAVTEIINPLAKLMVTVMSVILFACDPAKVLVLEAPKKLDYSVSLYAKKHYSSDH